MIRKRMPRLLLFGLVVLILVSVTFALTAANTVPVTRAADIGPTPKTANDLKPVECASLNLTAIVTGSGDFRGTSASELILGSPNADIIRGQGGDDCILGGGGDDTLRGGGGADICIGGPGNDTFINCATSYQ